MQKYKSSVHEHRDAGHKSSFSEDNATKLWSLCCYTFKETVSFKYGTIIKAGSDVIRYKMSNIF